MITQFLLVLVFGLAISLALTLLVNSIRSRIAYKKFKKTLPNIPFLDEDIGWFSNNLLKFATNKNAQIIHERHRQYGDTLGAMIHETPCIITCDLDLIKQVCLDNASKSINRLEFKFPIKEYENDCILFAVGDQWRRIRSAFAPALMPARIKVPNVMNEIESSVERIIHSIENRLNDQATASEEQNFEVNLDDLIHRFSLIVIMGCFYKQYNIIDTNLNKPNAWVETVDQGLAEINKNAIWHLGLIVPALRHVIDFVSLHLHPVGKWRKSLKEFIRIQTRLGIEARKQLAELKRRAQAAGGGKTIDEDNFVMEDGTKFRRNLVDYIIDQYLNGKLTQNEFFNSSSFLFSAADKTVTDSLVFTLYQLARNQDIQEKLRQSIRDEGEESEYLAWVINESLRLLPPVNGGPSRTLTYKLELKQGGILPEGSFFFISLHTIHRLKKYWGDDAEEFKPERWAKADTFHPCQYLPFGAGLRVCPGRYFAMFEMKKLICALMIRYRLSAGVKEDLDEFSSPLMIFYMNKTPFRLNISRV